MKKKKIQTIITSGKTLDERYHEVIASVTRKPNGRWTVAITESWGLDHGFDEEKIVKQIVGRDATMTAAADRALRLSQVAGINQELLLQSLRPALQQASEPCR